MRESVRRLCSPLIESKAMPMDTNGTRMLRNETNENGNASGEVVNSFRNRNGSSAVVSLTCWIALKTASIPNNTTSHSSTRMRTLVTWSLSSLRTTTPRPWRAEPSRCMASSHHVFEVAVVDLVKTGRLDRKPQQPAASGDHGCGCVRADVALGVDAHAIGCHGFH